MPSKGKFKKIKYGGMYGYNDIDQMGNNNQEYRQHGNTMQTTDTVDIVYYDVSKIVFNKSDSLYTKIVKVFIIVFYTLSNIIQKQMATSIPISNFIKTKENPTSIQQQTMANRTTSYPMQNQNYGFNGGYGEYDYNTTNQGNFNMNQGAIPHQGINKQVPKIKYANNFQKWFLYIILTLYIYILPLAIFITTFIYLFDLIINLINKYIRETKFLNDLAVYNEIDKLKYIEFLDIHIPLYIYILLIIFIIYLFCYFIMNVVYVDLLLINYPEKNKIAINSILYYFVYFLGITLVIYYIFGYNSTQSLGNHKHELDALVDNNINIEYIKFILHEKYLKNDQKKEEDTSEILYRIIKVCKTDNKILHNYINKILLERPTVNINTISLSDFKNIARNDETKTKYYDLIIKAIFTHLILLKLNSNHLYNINNQSINLDFFINKKSIFLGIDTTYYNLFNLQDIKNVLLKTDNKYIFEEQDNIKINSINGDLTVIYNNYKSNIRDLQNIVNGNNNILNIGIIPEILYILIITLGIILYIKSSYPIFKPSYLKNIGQNYNNEGY